MPKKYWKKMNKTKIENLKNGWLLLGLSIFFVGYVGFAQNIETNDHAIAEIKTKSSKRFIEKNLVGYWEFDKLTTPSGKVINEVETILDSLKMIEKISRPDVVFYKNKKYEIIDEGKNVVDKGGWFYDKKDDILRLIFDEPRYNVPIDKISSELLKELKEKKSLIEFTEDNWEIHMISSDELFIIEHLPHNEFDLKYNLRVYRKKR